MRHLIALLSLVLFTACSNSNKDEVLPSALIIPQPQQVESTNGHFELPKEISISAIEEFKIASDFLKDYLDHAGWKSNFSENVDATIRFEKKDSFPNEGYELTIDANGITISATTASGAFYGVQTLRQLLPASFENATVPSKVSLDFTSIVDAPKFAYRGAHLDVGRHFFDKEFVKKYIGYLAMLKMNYFHWHLTEDQGWRIEIKKYPKLTSHGAYRTKTLKGHYNDQPRTYDESNYGGFYTQEEIKEVVAFAEKMNITIIPEIEMPGHAQAAVSSYPELGCTGEEVEVASEWGIFDEVFCPKEETFTFLENVLTEVIALFPGPYIHIGGDEAPKTHWQNCKHCQELIKKEGLKDEHELQSYFIRRIETFLNENGKSIIGWDEILEGGLAPNATVMSWRGMEGGIAAAKEGHPVIMTPTSYCYFDYYQSESPNEPLAIGGYLPLEKVFSLNPIPNALSESEASYILGAQCNLWTEYIDSEKQVEYMLFPRVLALSEVVWHGPSENPKTDFPIFAKRVENYMERLDAMSVNYANHLYELSSDVNKKGDSILYEIRTLSEKVKIEYQVNEGTPQVYTSPILLTENSTIKAKAYVDEKAVGNVFMDTIKIHKGLKATTSLNVQPHENYNKGGDEAFNNGRIASSSRYGDSEWLGFWGDNIQISYTFKQPTELKKLHLRFFHAPGQWIYAPRNISLRLKFSNGKSSVVVNDYREFERNIAHVTLEVPQYDEPVYVSECTITIPNLGVIPEGAQGAGNKPWTFLDEIVVE